MSKQEEVKGTRNTVCKPNRSDPKSTLMHICLKASKFFIALVHVFKSVAFLQIYMTVTERLWGWMSVLSGHGEKKVG